MAPSWDGFRHADRRGHRALCGVFRMFEFLGLAGPCQCQIQRLARRRPRNSAWTGRLRQACQGACCRTGTSEELGKHDCGCPKVKGIAG